MQPASVTTNSGPTIFSTAEVGVEQLWRFQLRKENLAILEKIDANEKLNRAAAAEHDRKTEEALERIAVLEGKLLRLADANKKEQELYESRSEELEAIRAKMRELGETAEVNGLLAQLKGGPINVNNSGSDEADSGRPPLEVSAPTSGILPAGASSNQPRPSGSQSRSTNGELQRPISHRPAKAQDAYYGPPTTRSQRRFGEQATQIGIPPPVPRASTGSHPLMLRQREGAFQAYLESADRLYHSLPDAERPSDIEFVAMFIKGMRDSRGRERLSNKLQLLHPSRTRKDLTVEVLCQWEDVLEAVKSMGRLSGGAGASGKEVEGKQRRRNILVPRELVKGGG